MPTLRTLLREALPTRADWAQAAGLWLKALLFLLLLFNADRPGFSLAPLNREVFRSLLRPVTHLALILGALAPLHLLPSRWRLPLFRALSAALSLLLLADLWHYRALRTLLSLDELRIRDALVVSPGLVAPFARPWDVLLFLDLLLPGLPWPEGGPEPRRALARAAACLGCLGLIGPVGGGLLKSPSAAEAINVEESAKTATRLSPLGYHGLDLALTLAGRRHASLDLSPGDRAAIAAWFDGNRREGAPSPLHGRFRGWNLLVIQVESLEATVLGRRIGDEAVTPVLDGLRAHGLAFTNFHEQVRAGVSSDADLMTNTSVYPLAEGPTFCLFPRAPLPSLPRILGNRGYRTLALHPHPGTVWNCVPALDALGFERNLDSAAFDCREAWGFGLTDASFLAQAAPLLAAQKQPFYAFLATQSSHMPFDPPEYVRELHLGDLDREVMGGYLQAVHYADKHLGHFLEDLRRRGLLDHTLVAVTGDHQGVNKFFLRDLEASPHRQAWWVDPSRRLPFLLSAPGLAPGEVATPGGQVDLMPTLLDLLGADGDPEARALMGHSLLRGSGPCVLADGTLVGSASPEAARHCAEGPRIADLVIRGGYFRNRLPDLAARARRTP